MKIAILGFGLQGRSAYDYWSGDNDITVCDLDKEVELPDGAASKLGEDYLSNLDAFDLLVRSPSIHPQDIVKANGPDILKKVTTVTNEFFKVCPCQNIIGVTGTKGKGTTATLIAKILEAAGKKVHLGGNIGTPPLDMLKDGIGQTDYVVLELANFQLIDLTHSPSTAVCLMVAPEHLNWHEDMDEYVTAKSQLFRYQDSSDIAIYYAANKVSEGIASAGSGRKVPYYAPPGAYVDEDQVKIGDQTVCSVSDIKLIGKHNWQNVCAAITAVWQIDHNVDAIRNVLSTFTGLEHRIELVRELRGVRYYDDSFGTTPETAIAAIEAFSEPEILILGGRGKGVPFNELAKVVKRESSHIPGVLLIGEDKDKIAEALRAEGYGGLHMSDASTMQEVVGQATALAEDIGKDSVVLLSTACTSFDMFANYKDRGEQFKSAVEQLS
jgi:UDP-N-acetylmuramoylalanine--D-glutamate ligase